MWCSKVKCRENQKNVFNAFHFFFFFLLIASALFSQNKSDETPALKPPPKQVVPADLEPGWWNQLIENTENLQKDFQKLNDNVEAVANTLSKGDKKRAKTLANEIKLNLQAYLKVKDQPLPDPPMPTPFADTYSLEKLLSLYEVYTREKLRIEGIKDQRTELQQLIKNLQERIDLVRISYEASKERSEKKILHGLQIISLFPALETAKSELKLVNKTIENEDKILEFLREELELSEERIVSTPTELQRLGRQLDLKMQLWQEATRNRQSVERKTSKKVSNDLTEEAKRRSENLQQEQIEAELKEIAAHNQYIRTEILYTLSKILIEPGAVDINSLGLSLRDWQSQLSTMKPLLSEKEALTERVVARAAQLLTLQKNKADFKSESELELIRKTVELGQQNLLAIEGLKKQVEESLFLYGVINEKSAGLRGVGAQWFRTAIDFSYDFLIAAQKALGTTLFYLGSHPVTTGAIIQFLAIMVIAWWAAKFLTAFLNRIARQRKGVRKAVIYRINTLFRYLLLFLGFLVALTSIGFDFSNLALIAGALGIGIGFGLQHLFNDFISGIIILFQSQLKVGDFIVLDSNVRGEIREINVRSTVLTTNDGVDVIIPNSEMLSSRVINWTLRDPYRRMHIPFGVAYGSDIDEVSRIVVGAAKKVPCTLDKIGVPEPQVFMKEFGDNALVLDLVVWINEKWTRRQRKTHSMYLFAIEKALKKHHIAIPFPQMDLHVKMSDLYPETDRKSPE